MKKTLIIAPNYPLPESQGSHMRTMNFARYFAGYGKVDILCTKLDRNTADLNDGTFSKEYFVDCSENKQKSKNYFKRVLDKLIRLKTWSTSHYSYDSQQMIKGIVSEGNYDFIVCRYLSQAYPLIDLDVKFRLNILLDVDDIVTDVIYDSETNNYSGLDKLAKIIDKYITIKYYNKCFKLCRVLFCSEEDRFSVEKYANCYDSYVVPNVIPFMVLPDYYSCNGYDSVNNLLFVGSLGYSPNLKGITWFITEIFPEILKEFGDVRLFVIGRNPSQQFSELVQKHPHVEMHSNVSDLVPFYERCGLSVVPLLAGGGTRIKILESGFAKRPVMSTAIGAYGLGMSDGEELMIFKDSQSFLDRYRKMRKDRELYCAMTDRLTCLVERNFSYSAFQRTMDAIVSRLLN